MFLKNGSGKRKSERYSLDSGREKDPLMQYLLLLIIITFFITVQSSTNHYKADQRDMGVKERNSNAFTNHEKAFD